MAYDIKKKGHKAVFAIFDNRSSVESAVTRLKADGFRHSDLSVLMQDVGDTKAFAHEMHTKAPEGAATGATTGALAGGALGWLAGAGALAIPGIGPFVAAGPIMSAIAGAGIGGTVGGVAGGLIGMGIPEYEAKRFESEVKNGGMLISVHVDDADWASKAKEIVRDCGARDISVASEETGAWKFLDDDRVETGYFKKTDYASAPEKRTDDMY
jgi:hypothetical protein